MTLRDQGEAKLLAGKYQEAVPLLLRGARADWQDDFQTAAIPAVWSMLLLSQFDEAEALVAQMASKAFAAISSHQELLGWSRWFRHDHAGAISHFLKASQAGYRGIGWAMAVYFASIRGQNAIVSDEAVTHLLAAKRQLSPGGRNSNCIDFALGDLSEAEFVQRMSVWNGRGAKLWIPSLRLIANFWIGLRRARLGDEAGFICHFLEASRPGRYVSIFDELAVARLELQRLGIDPLTGGEFIPRSATSPAAARDAMSAAAIGPGPAGRAGRAQGMKSERTKQFEAAPETSPPTDAVELSKFVSLLGVAAPRRALERVLVQLNRHTNLRSRESKPRSERRERLIVSSIMPGRYCVQLPDSVGDVPPLARKLSRVLGCPVFWCHVHDGDLWMYVLYCNGKAIDQFNPLPDYWPAKLSIRQRRAWKGNATKLAAHWPGLNPEEVAAYLREWSAEVNLRAKAYPDDTYSFYDCRQVLDFLKRLGLQHPGDRRGGVKITELPWN